MDKKVLILCTGLSSFMNSMPTIMIMHIAIAETGHEVLAYKKHTRI